MARSLQSDMIPTEDSWSVLWVWAKWLKHGKIRSSNGLIIKILSLSIYFKHGQSVKNHDQHDSLWYKEWTIQRLCSNRRGHRGKYGWHFLSPLASFIKWINNNKTHNTCGFTIKAICLFGAEFINQSNFRSHICLFTDIRKMIFC